MTVLAGCAPGRANPEAERDAGPAVADRDSGLPASAEDAGVGSEDAGSPSGTEVCGGEVDDDADSSIDEGCACPSATPTRDCYTGPPETAGVGACHAGTQVCEGTNEFGAWASCEDQGLPAEEQCDDQIDNDCDGEVDEGCTATVMPAQCTLMTLTHVRGAQDCDANHAVYMVDDGDGPNLICCPLPATDILRVGTTVERGSQCAPGEVITGAVGRFNFRCTAINTDRYQLTEPVRPCYFGSGASGSRGVSRCADHPTSFSVLNRNLFGSDGCSGQPYGALFTQQSGDECRDMRAGQLQYTGVISGDPEAGTPVPMFVDE